MVWSFLSLGSKPTLLVQGFDKIVFFLSLGNHALTSADSLRSFWPLFLLHPGPRLIEMVGILFRNVFCRCWSTDFRFFPPFFGRNSAFASVPLDVEMYLTCLGVAHLIRAG